MVGPKRTNVALSSRFTVRSGRRLFVASLLFGLFVLADIGLFGWLIFRSLSQREIDRVLSETRQEAVGLADRIAEGVARRDPALGQDLYTAVTVERETATYIDNNLAQRDVVGVVEVYDRDGVLVYKKDTRETFPGPLVLPKVVTGELAVGIEHRTAEQRSTYDVTVPIGQLGSLRIGIAEAELGRRLAGLRADLVRQTMLLGGLTVAFLCLAYWALWVLWQRAGRLELEKAEAERLAYVGTLASGLAHEIRNPLNSLNLNMQLLEEDLPPSAQSASARRLLELTQSELGRLERLVTDFLSYARPRPLELEETTARELFEPLIAVHRGPIAAVHAEVTIEDHSHGAAVRVDRAQLGQLLLNLLQNALAATAAVDRPAEVVLRASRRADQLVLEVSDNGAGIAPEDLGRVFEIFYSTKKGGTGLGLAIVDRIARAHDGALAVRSTPGQGTTVSLALPIEQGAAKGVSPG